MIRLGLLTLLMFSFCSSFAGAEIATTVGSAFAFFRSTDASDPKFVPRPGVSFGALLYQDLSLSWQLRSGLYFTQRVARVTADGSTANMNFGYINIPITALYELNETLGVFAGVVPAVKTSSDCDGDMQICNADYIASANLQVFGAQLGGQVKIVNHWALEAIYDYGISENSIDTRADALSASLQYIF